MKVIIIGAGLSGLTAAKDLNSLGIDVTVLEARNRIGGRIAPGSHLFNGTPIDLGASWIHGVDGNPLTDIAKELNLTLDVTNNPNLTTGENYEIYDSEGQKIDAAMQQKLRKQFDLLTSAGEKVLEKFDRDLSIEEMLEHTSKIAAHHFSADEHHFINWLKAGMEGWDNTDLSDISARNHFWEHTAPLYNGGDGFVADGFYNIVHHIGKGLENKIRLSHIVERVEYNDFGVIVYTNKGIFMADYVISTLPLGVLKSKSIDFVPPLPAWKEESIERIGFGLMNKIYMEFPEIFWNPKLEGMGYVSKAHRGEFGFFITLNSLLKKPILVCFVAAEFAKKAEEWTDEQIIDRIVEILGSICNYKVPRPIAHAITRWGSDPFARGSYSFMRVHSTPAHLDALSRPVGRIHFAGEATAKYPGYTHGAYLSAKREVERIKRIIATAQIESRIQEKQPWANSPLQVAPVSIRAKL